VGKKTPIKQFDAALSFNKMAEAYSRARIGKTDRPGVMNFERRLEANLIKILDDLRAEKYVPSEYNAFTITDPKERLILALPFRDRVVHQWYVEEFIKPFYVPKFIADSYACIVGRGTHKAVNKAHYYMRKMRKERGDFYILKMDISKFFYSIDRDILFEILSRKIPDPKVLGLAHTILYNAPECGIPIGNYTSQYFANIYLNELDQYVKHTLRVRYYIRYMDDFVCFVENKAEAKRIFEAISAFIDERLHLKLNSKSRYFPSKMGLDFCGVRLFFDYKLLRKRAKKSLQKIMKDFERNKDEAAFMRRLVSWQANAKRADTYTFRLFHLLPYMEVIDRYYAELRKPKTRPKSDLMAPPR